jgi:hypothetical protein
MLPTTESQNAEPAHKLLTALYGRIPALHDIEKMLEETPPGEIGLMIENEPLVIFLLDYYLRLFDPELGGRIVSHPDFTLDQTEDLYSCQLIRYYRSNLTTELDQNYSSIFESYWSRTSKSKLFELFRKMLTGSRNRVYASILLQNFSTDELDLLVKEQSIKSVALLDLFKIMGKHIQEMFRSNFDLFDYILTLAHQLGDTEYLQFLEEFTVFNVRLRIASSYLDDIRLLLDKDGHPPFKELSEMVIGIPREVRQMVLFFFVQEGIIPETMASSFMKFSSFLAIP